MRSHEIQHIKKFLSKGMKVKLFLCLIKQAPSHENVLGSGVIDPPFLTLALDGSEWLGKLSGKIPLHPFNRMPQSRSRCHRVRKNILTLPGFKPWLPSP
jgi:hypothetical protein